MIEKKIHLIGRIDQIVRDYFDKNNSVNQILVKDLMPLFIKKKIFKKDHRNGLPIRNVLRELDSEKKLFFIKNLEVIRNKINRNWYFIRK